MKLQWMLLSLISIFPANRTLAQVVPDTTLGTESTIVTPNGTTQLITGGATRGSNLFHSLQELSIGTDQTAWFNHPTTIQNVLVRVTGGNASTIDGTLQSNGTADLFLINPSGIIFGQNAKLNIGGAFSAMTTPAIPLGTQGVFSATAPAQSQLLDIKPSATFDLTRWQPQGSLQMGADWAMNGQAITLIGQNVTMTGRLSNTTASANLTLRSSNDITLTQTQINNPTGSDLYSAANGFAPISVNLQAGGNITIKDSNIGIYGGGFQSIAPGLISLDNSRILSQSSIAQPAAPILLQAGKVEILNRSGITIPTTDNLALADRNYNPVPLTIRSTATLLVNGSRINQPPGDRNLRPASFDAELRATQPRTNLAPISISFESGADIQLQNSAIATRGGAFRAAIPGNFVLEGSQLYSDSFMAQAAEPIFIQATNIRLSNFNRRGQPSQVGGDIGISSNSIGGGQAATISLSASNDLLLTGGAGIGSNTLTNSNTGNIILSAGNTYEMNSAGIGNQSRANTFREPNKQITGNNGQVVITAKNIKLNKFGFNMDHFSQGGNGRIVFNAQETIDIGEGGIGTNARGSAIGANIIVQSKALIMRPRSALSTSAERQSQGGSIQIKADRFQLQGSISTSTRGSGKAGDVAIVAPIISLEEGRFSPTEISRGTISTYTGTSGGRATATGNSGNIQIVSQGDNAQILLQSGAGIANTIFKDSTGNAGQIVVRSEQLEVQRGSQILVVTNSNGNAGLIDIQAAKSIKLIGDRQTGTDSDNRSPSGILSTIQTTAQGGNSAGISIDTPRLEISGGAGIISSTLGRGNSGQISITADTVLFSDQNTQGNSSGVLTSVGLGQIPGGELLKVESFDPRFSTTTLNPLVISQQDNPTATGDSGDIRMSVGNLEILKGAQLITAIVGNGKAGNISIQGKGNISLIDRAGIRADSESGQGGSINIDNPQGVLFLRRGSNISAVSRQGGRDGNININSGFIVGIPLENSNIFAVSEQALKGGSSVGNNVKISAQSILGFAYSPRFTEQNDIIATGNVTLNLPDIDPYRGLTVLPINPIEVAQKIDRACNPNADSTSSSFVNLSKGGLPANPTNTIVPKMILTRLAQIPNNSQVSNHSQAIVAPNPTIPREAISMQRLANKTIRFTVGDHAPNLPKPNCG